MTVRNRCLIDTNILIYAVDNSAGTKHQKAALLVAEAAKYDCWLSVQVLGEFFHAVTRKNITHTDKAVELIHAWKEVFPVAVADAETLGDAIEYVRDHQLSFWDAMLWVTAKQADCAFVLSEDMQHGQRIGGVEIANPFLPVSKDLLDRLFG